MTSLVADIAVVGGGAAGIAAAVAAARRGARVCLIERDTLFGGNATTAMVGTICGISRCHKDARQPITFDNPGFASEFAKAVASASGTSLTRNHDGLTYLPYRPAAFHSVAHMFIESLPAISRFTHCILSSASRRDDDQEFHLTLARCAEPPVHLSTKAIIDASGDAVATRMLGLQTIEPQEHQAAALVFELSGLPPLDERTLSFSLRKILREEALERGFPEEFTFVSVVPGSLREGAALFKLGTPHPLSEEYSITARVRAVVGIESLVSRLKERSTDFQNIHHTNTASRLGVRSGSRGVGEETLEDAAVRHSLPHIKGIALGLWPVEVWSTPERPRVEFPEQGYEYEIPVGSLCAKGSPGVYFAGRVIAATDYAIASARVIGTCLSTGYAAGRLAAGTIDGEDLETITRDLRHEQVSPLRSLSQTGT